MIYLTVPYLDYDNAVCNWVPTVFHTTNSGRRVYGGIDLQPNMVSGTVPMISGIQRYEADIIFRNAPVEAKTLEKRYETGQKPLDTSSASAHPIHSKILVLVILIINQ